MIEPSDAIFPIDVPVRDWVADHSVGRPGKTAVHCVDTGESRTWAEFDQRVGVLAGGLRMPSASAGDRVSLLAENQRAHVRAALRLRAARRDLRPAELAPGADRAARHRR